MVTETALLPVAGVIRSVNRWVPLSYVAFPAVPPVALALTGAGE
jgi:hypothetical protein